MGNSPVLGVNELLEMSLAVVQVPYHNLMAQYLGQDKTPNCLIAHFYYVIVESHFDWSSRVVMVHKAVGSFLENNY